jgi:6-phosphogluconolactonase (cycloisomerase 2 family)
LLCGTAVAVAGGLLSVSNNAFLFEFVQDSNGAQILGWSIAHSKSGALTSTGTPFVVTLAQGEDSSGFVPALGVDPTGHFLLLANESSNLIHVFQIAVTGQQLGTLKEVAGSPFGDGSIVGTTNVGVSEPAFLAVSKAGNFVFSSDFAHAQIQIFSLNASGALAQSAGSPHLTDNGESAVFMAVHPSGNFLYTVENNGNDGAISVYGFDGAGDLNVVATSPTDLIAAIPLELAFDSSGKFLYAPDQTSTNAGIFGFALDSTGNGALNGQVPNSPFPLSAITFPGIVGNPSLEEIYVSNQTAPGTFVINPFSVNSSTGTLTPPTNPKQAVNSNMVIANVQ